MKHCVVTTFHGAGYEQYGKRCLESFLRNWPASVPILVYPEEAPVSLSDARLQLIDPQTMLPKLQWFKAEYRDNPFANGTSPINPERVGDFRWQACRFSNKVFAVTDAIKRCKGVYDQLIWLDADTVTHTRISDEFLDRLAPKRKQLASYLNRRGCPECGWVGYNLNHAEIMRFAERFEQIYLTGEFLTFKENHDSYIFWEIAQEMQRSQTASFKLLGSRWRSGHIFLQSALGDYLDHLKGDRKIVGRSKERDNQSVFRRILRGFRQVLSHRQLTS